jgi:hypothetical protein
MLDLTADDLMELGDEFEAARDRGLSPAEAAELFIERLHEIRKRRQQSEHPRCTVPAVLAECDAETLSDIWQGGGQGR